MSPNSKLCSTNMTPRHLLRIYPRFCGSDSIGTSFIRTVLFSVISAVATLSLSGCAVGVVGATAVGTELVVETTWGCFTRVCGKPPEDPPHIAAAKVNDAKALHQMIAEKPGLVAYDNRVDSLLNPAFEADSADIVRLLVPKYADPNRQIQDPRNPYSYSLLARSLHHGCRTPTVLLELGASPTFAHAYLPIHDLAIHGVKKEKTADCLVATKSLVAAGYVPSQKDLDSALSVALNGCCGWGNRLPQYHNVPNVALADYLRSIGAVETR